MNNDHKVIELEKVTKRFGQVVANDRVTMDVEKGEIHALLGENGSGKTTLMNILYGLLQPEGGRIRVEGEVASFRSPRDAIRLGIGMVHQHFMLVPTLTVVENIVMGTRPTGRVYLDIRRVESHIGEISKTYGLEVDPSTPVWQLSVGVQQRVEILKVLYRNARILILDEPTAVLTPIETEELFQTLRTLTEKGCSVIFISHKLSEVMAISQRITVLRQGKVAATVRANGTTPRDLARMMVGREVFLKVEKEKVVRGEPLLVIEGISADNDKGLPGLRNISFKINGGEILGFAGVEGNGQRELAEVISGLRPVRSGRIQLCGKDVTHASTRERMELGLAHIPEDRKRRGLVLEFSIWENAILENYYRAPFDRGCFLQFAAIRKAAQDIVRQFDVKTSGLYSAVGELSGGNQQKLLVGRELYRDPLVLLAAQPTRGLDVGAIEYIHSRLLEQRAAGKAIILISTELDEILSLSDRVAILNGGQIIGEMTGDEIDMDVLGLMMAGRKPDYCESNE